MKRTTTDETEAWHCTRIDDSELLSSDADHSIYKSKGNSSLEGLITLSILVDFCSTAVIVSSSKKCHHRYHNSADDTWTAVTRF